MLIVGALLFFGAHLVPNIGGIRTSLIEGLGEKAYMTVYSILSLIGITLMFVGRSRAGFELLWIGPQWLHIMTMVLMFVSLYCFLAMFMPTNIKKWVRHPMLTFMLLFGFAHLVSNGDVASLIFFGSLTVFSLFKIISLTKRKSADEFMEVSMGKDLIVLSTTFALYILVIYIHPFLANGIRVL
jgi:uncharacterized membrane protein